MCGIFGVETATYTHVWTHGETCGHDSRTSGLSQRRILDRRVLYVISRPIVVVFLSGSGNSPSMGVSPAHFLFSASYTWKLESGTVGALQDFGDWWTFISIFYTFSLRMHRMCYLWGSGKSCDIAVKLSDPVSYKRASIWRSEFKWRFRGLFFIHKLKVGHHVIKLCTNSKSNNLRLNYSDLKTGFELKWIFTIARPPGSNNAPAGQISTQLGNARLRYWWSVLEDYNFTS